MGQEGEGTPGSCGMLWLACLWLVCVVIVPTTQEQVGAVPDPLGKESWLASGSSLQEQSVEAVRLSWFDQMSRQHRMPGLHFRSYSTPSLLPSLSPKETVILNLACFISIYVFILSFLYKHAKTIYIFFSSDINDRIHPFATFLSMHFCVFLSLSLNLL